ncbi:MAG: hypothetical protein WBG47_13395 [Gordonia sp. (in: high G+C Gram-positive bacteria)]|uniref:hypothetical protein n=1 Tax=Gordonia sp. (in: high G+C Gram-positive bacteria) TaxID=84139 RepID=UPI003C7283C8
MSQGQLDAMVRAILRMHIVMVNGQPELLYASGKYEPPRRLEQETSRHRVNEQRRLKGSPATTDGPVHQLPDLLGVLVFVRHLGGAYRGHDHRNVPVCWGDELIVLAGNTNVGLAGAKKLPQVRIKGVRWHGWEIKLPDAPTDTYVRWLDVAGITAESASRRTRLVTPPVAYEQDQPIYRGSTFVTALAGTGEVQTVVVGQARRAVVGPKLAPARMHQIMPSPQTMRVKLSDGHGIPGISFSLDDGPAGTRSSSWTVAVDGETVGDPLIAPRIDCVQHNVVTIQSSASNEFSITSVDSSGVTHRLLCAPVGEANQWIAEQAPRSSELVVSSNSPARIVLKIAADEVVPPTPSYEPVQQIPTIANRWPAAYAAATHRTSTREQHWQIRDRSAAGTRYRRKNG